MQALPEWLQQFDGRLGDGALSRGAILATTGGEGWPHLAYLSAGEILAQHGGISIALWPNSRTAANIARDGRAILHVVAEGRVWEARLSLKPRSEDSDGPAIFDGAILETRDHPAPYASVEGLVVFRLHDEAATRARWQAQLERLRAR
jgi:hypothetical protein